jgi:hypothetical protein
MAMVKLLTGTTADYQEVESILILDEREIAVEIVTDDSGQKYFNIRQGDGKSTFFNLPIIVNNKRSEELNTTITQYYNTILDKSYVAETAANSASASAAAASKNATAAADSASKASTSATDASNYATSAANAASSAEDAAKNALSTTPDGFADLVTAFNALGLSVNSDGEICSTYNE